MPGQDPPEHTSKETKRGKDVTQGTWNNICLGIFFFCRFQCLKNMNSD